MRYENIPKHKEKFIVIIAHKRVLAVAQQLHNQS